MKKFAVILFVAVLCVGCATRSPIQAAVYDANHESLIIQFSDGSRYVYVDVPALVIDELWAAKSRGRYFNYQIRSRYDARRLNVALK